MMFGNSTRFTITLVSALFATWGLQATTETAEAQRPVDVAVIDTDMGKMEILFWDDVAPKTVANFKKLAKEKFYDGTAFHRIIKGFMVQGGDPLSKDESQKSMWGTGGPGYNVEAEFNDRKHVRGVISMARSRDPNSAGSQFFICLDAHPHLDGQYTAFGKLIAGDDVLAKLGDIQTGGREGSSPVQRINVNSITIEQRTIAEENNDGN